MSEESSSEGEGAIEDQPSHGLKAIADVFVHIFTSSQEVVKNYGTLPHRPVSLKGRTQRKLDWRDYSDFPLLESLLRYEERRNKFLDQDGKTQKCCPRSTSGWVRTLFVLKGRALDWIVAPWLFVTLHAVLYSLLDVHVFGFNEDSTTSEWQTIFSFALNTTLGFMLVFRLNRAAVRFWFARGVWGILTVSVRNIASGLLVHGNHDPVNRDEALRWLTCFALVSKDFIRGEVDLAVDAYIGILSEEERKELEQNHHPPLFVGLRIRGHIKDVFGITADTDTNLAISRTQQMNILESELNRMMEAQASMERIQGTPLPLVYVSHLRTFLLINLLLIPWVWGAAWGWFTPFIVGVVAFAFLGIEAASAEVEIPFRKDRVNALDMDGFCKGILTNILQLLVNFADDFASRQHRDLRKSATTVTASFMSVE